MNSSYCNHKLSLGKYKYVYESLHFAVLNSALCVTLKWGFAFELTKILQGGYCEVSGWELAFSQNPIRFVKRDWFVSDSLFPFPSSFPAKKLQMGRKLNYVIASIETFGKYFQILHFHQSTNNFEVKFNAHHIVNFSVAVRFIPIVNCHPKI